MALVIGMPPCGG